MSDSRVVTPIVFIVFNRPNTTAYVLEMIRRARPRQLFVIADGPRSHYPDDARKCAQVRQMITSGVDWDCEVITNYADVNMGCGKRVATGLTWVFEQVEEAIILEDDCLPDSSFFYFCQELLAKYKFDERICMISGDNFQIKKETVASSYYFSSYLHIWGWATWRRAWKNFDYEMKSWPKIKCFGLLRDILPNSEAISYWSKLFDLVYTNKIDTWDYRWVFACWSQRQISITPNVNLISNIGFGIDATHTKQHGALSNLPTQPMPFPLHHPCYVMRDINADDYSAQTLFARRYLLQRVFDKINRIIKRIINDL